MTHISFKQSKISVSSFHFDLDDWRSTTNDWSNQFYLWNNISDSANVLNDFGVYTYWKLVFMLRYINLNSFHIQHLKGWNCYFKIMRNDLCELIPFAKWVLKRGLVWLRKNKILAFSEWSICLVYRLFYHFLFKTRRMVHEF